MAGVVEIVSAFQDAAGVIWKTEREARLSNARAASRQLFKDGDGVYDLWVDNGRNEVLNRLEAIIPILIAEGLVLPARGEVT